MIKLFFKIVIAFGIFYWLISTGRLDFTLVLESWKHPQSFILGILLIAIQIATTGFRFCFLIRTKSSAMSFKKIIGIQWIAQLFSTVIPGGITSDLIKIGYIKELDEKLSRSFIFFMILFDRIIGLSSLLFISGIASLYYFKELSDLNPMMEKVITINIVFFFLTIIGIAFIFINERCYSSLLKVIPGKKLKEMAVEIWAINKHKRLFAASYLVSVLAHLLSIFAFWMVNRPFFQAPISFKYLATLIPLGQFATIIPISPGGIGVGHAAYSTLFNFIHHSNGASLFNVFWIMVMMANCLGIFPFLFKRNYRKDFYGSRNL